MTTPNHNLSSLQFQDGSYAGVSPAQRYAEGLNALSGANAKFSAGTRGATMTHVKQERYVNEDVMSGRPFIMRHREGLEQTTHAIVQNVTGEVFSPTRHGVIFDNVDTALHHAREDGDQVHRGAYLRPR